VTGRSAPSERMGFVFEPHVLPREAMAPSQRLEPEAAHHRAATHADGSEVVLARAARPTGPSASAAPAQIGRTRYDVGAIVRSHRAELEAAHRLSPQQKRVLTDIAQCRTAVLGGHLDVCRSCGYERPSYNSCRNRHCPKCQALAAETWIDKRSERLLDVGHFHVVFTVPAQLRPLAQHAPEVVYEALFGAARCTLLELGHERFGATLGATLVLHTWTRDLRYHPHVHAIVTAGGLTRDDARFHHSPRYLFPVKTMGQRLRGKMLHALSNAYAKGAFVAFADFQDPAAFGRLVARLAKLSWNVDARVPFKKSKHVLNYLGRYTHRVGIANSRLLDVTDERVVFRTKGGGTATVTPVEFLRRFVQHVLPDRFHKIRHVGLYASAQRLALARARLTMAAPAPRPRLSWQQRLLAKTGRDVERCPICAAPLVHIPLPPARGPPAGFGRRLRHTTTSARPDAGWGHGLVCPRCAPNTPGGASEEPDAAAKSPPRGNSGRGTKHRAPPRTSHGGEAPTEKRIEPPEAPRARRCGLVRRGTSPAARRRNGRSSSWALAKCS